MHPVRAGASRGRGLQHDPLEPRAPREPRAPLASFCSAIMVHEAPEPWRAWWTTAKATQPSRTAARREDPAQKRRARAGVPTSAGWRQRGGGPPAFLGEVGRSWSPTGPAGQRSWTLGSLPVQEKRRLGPCIKAGSSAMCFGPPAGSAAAAAPPGWPRQTAIVAAAPVELPAAAAAAAAAAARACLQASGSAVTS